MRRSFVRRCSLVLAALALLATPDERDLEGRGPPALGHLVAAAVPEPRHQRALDRGVLEPRVGGRHAMGVDGAVQHGHGVGDGLVLAVLVEPSQPLLGLGLGDPGGRDHGRPGRGHRRRIGLRVGPLRPAPSEQAALRRAQRGEHQDVGRILAGDEANHVAAVVGPQCPGELELSEAEALAGVGQGVTRRRGRGWSGPSGLRPSTA